MKKTFALCVALLACGSAFAQEESETAVTMELPYVTKYVFRGLQIAKDSFQPSVEVTSGSVYGGVWSSIPLHDRRDKETQEIDLYAAYAPKLTDKLSADIGITYYYYPRVDRPDANDSLELFAGLNATLGNFTPAAYIYRDLVLDTTTLQTSIGYSVPLKGLGTSLDLSVTFGSVIPDHDERYCYYSAGVNVPYKLSDRVKLNVGVTYTENDLDYEKDPGLWGTASIAISF